MGPLNKKKKKKKTSLPPTPQLSNKDKFSRHLSNKRAKWVGRSTPRACRIPTPPRARWRPGCSSALPPWALRPSWAKKGRRDCRPRAPRPVATPTGPSGGRKLQALGRAAPGEGGEERQGLPHPARSPGTRDLLPRPPPLRPLRPMASSPRDSQLQPLVGRRRHRAPLAPSSSFRPPRPAQRRHLFHGTTVHPAPRPQRPARPTPLPAPFDPERTGGGRGQTCAHAQAR